MVQNICLKSMSPGSVSMKGGMHGGVFAEKGWNKLLLEGCIQLRNPQ